MGEEQTIIPINIQSCEFCKHSADGVPKTTGSCKMCDYGDQWEENLRRRIYGKVKVKT